MRGIRFDIDDLTTLGSVVLMIAVLFTIQWQEVDPNAIMCLATLCLLGLAGIWGILFWSTK